LRGIRAQAAGNLAVCWRDLAGDDAARAYDALFAFRANAAQAIAFLTEGLQPARVDAGRIGQLIADLDNEQFAVRQKSSTELESIGQPAAALMRKALENSPSQEVRKRLESILTNLDAAVPRGAGRREVRAIEVLEYLATPEARQFLEKLAQGAPEARLTREAKAALERLSKRAAP
jgi:hypothetical protein